MLDANAVSKMGPHFEKNGSTEATFTMALDTPLEIKLNAGDDDLAGTINGAKFATPGSDTYADVPLDMWTYTEDGTFTLIASAVNVFYNDLGSGSTIKFYFAHESGPDTVLTATLVK